MRVAVINQHPADVVGGSELQCDLVARGLFARGHDVVYLAVDPEPAPAAMPDVPYRLHRVAADAAAIVEACVAVRAEVAYWRMNRLRLPGVVTSLEAVGVPLVFAIAHEDDVTRWPVRPWLREVGLRDRLHEWRLRVRHRRSWSSLGRVAAVASQREDLLGRAPVRDQRLIRNLMPEAEEAFHWPRPYLTWVGSLQQRKRPEVLEDVADAIAPSGVDLVVAGELRDARYLPLVSAASARPNLHHVGVLSQAQVLGLLHGARATVITAREEGFANVLLQSWWHGTPTVSLGYDPDGLIERESLGAVCGEDLPTFLAAVRRSALQDPRTEHHGQRIAAFVRRAFDTATTLDLLEGLLEDVRR